MALRHEAYRDEKVPKEAPTAIIGDQLDDSDLEDEFSDANDEFLHCEMDLETTLRRSDLAIHKFLNNEFNEARAILQNGSKSSMYPCLGLAVIEFIPAILTFDPNQISIASIALKRVITLCNQHRRNYSLVESIGSMLTRHDYSAYTDLEAHAELVYGEALMLQAILSFIEDEDLTAFIKGTFKIKSCYSSYKLANKILQHKIWNNEVCHRHFQSGVQMGIGTFNLLISMLPGRIISILEFVGFQGNKNEGLRQLEAGCVSYGLRQQLCQLTMLTYHLIICHYNGKMGDLNISHSIIERQLATHPRGVWFLLFRGRLHFMAGRYDEALRGYQAAIDSQQEWKQVHHMCYWEIMWLHSLKKEWRAASGYCARLLEVSMWSHTIYSYQRAAMLLQEEQISEIDKRTCKYYITVAPTHRQRIAGKSLPMEKFIIRRCNRFAAQQNHLVLPALEMMCLWNVFETLTHNPQAGHEILELTQKAIGDFIGQNYSWEAGYEADNRALIYYIHGSCLRHMGEFRLAVRALEHVVRFKDNLKEDHFLIPYAIVEMAFCMFSEGDPDKGMQLLNDARKKYTGYSLESRLHFRIHAKLQEENDKRATVADKHRRN